MPVRDELLLYYERELTFLRQMGAEFGEKYPKVASRLVLEPDKCDDPHVERLLEAFAFLAARVHLKIDDEFPEITEALLEHSLSALHPADSVDVDRAVPPGPGTGQDDHGHQIEPRVRALFEAVDGVPCKFRTCYETTLWPLNVVGGGMENARPACSRRCARPKPRPPCAWNCNAFPTWTSASWACPRCVFT